MHIPRKDVIKVTIYIIILSPVSGLLILSLFSMLSFVCSFCSFCSSDTFAFSLYLTFTLMSLVLHIIFNSLFWTSLVLSAPFTITLSISYSDSGFNVIVISSPDIAVFCELFILPFSSSTFVLISTFI